MSRFHLFAGGHFKDQIDHLALACSAARDAARARVGLLFEIKRIEQGGDVLEAKYEVTRSGALKAWVR
jgi:hypothetical protein